MWFKNLLFVSYTASWVIMVGAAPWRNIENQSRRRYVAEGIAVPVLPRLEWPYLNGTSSSRTVETTSKIATTSVVVISTSAEFLLSGSTLRSNTPSVVVSQAPSPSRSPTSPPLGPGSAPGVSHIETSNVVATTTIQGGPETSWHSSIQERPSSAAPSLDTKTSVQDGSPHPETLSISSGTPSARGPSGISQSSFDVKSDFITIGLTATPNATPTPLLVSEGTSHVFSSQATQVIDSITQSRQNPTSTHPNGEGITTLDVSHVVLLTGSSSTYESAKASLIVTSIVGNTNESPPVPVPQSTLSSSPLANSTIQEVSLSSTFTTPIIPSQSSHASIVGASVITIRPSSEASISNNLTASTQTPLQSTSPIPTELSYPELSSAGAILPTSKRPLDSVLSISTHQTTAAQAHVQSASSTPSVSIYPGVPSASILPPVSSWTVESIISNSTQALKTAPDRSAMSTSLSGVSTAAVTAPSTVNTSPPILPSLTVATLVRFNDTAPLETSTAVSELSTISANAPSESAPPTSASDNNATSPLAFSKIPATTTTNTLEWAHTSVPSMTRSNTIYSGWALPTAIVSNTNGTRPSLSQNTVVPGWHNNTFPSTNLIVVASVDVASTQTRVVISPTSTAILESSSQGTSKTSAATSASTGSATQTTVTAPSPPLTTSQTAGVVVAGAAGILICAVAAIFIFRRYRNARQAKHQSARSSIYPKEVYLYDPPLGGVDDRFDTASTFMSGGAGGMPRDALTSRAPQNTPNYTRRHSASELHYSDPGNPFLDSEDIFQDFGDFQITSTQPASIPYATIEQSAFSNTSPSSSSTAYMPLVPNVDIPSTTLSPLIGSHGLRHSHTRSTSIGSVNSKYIQLVTSCYTSTNAATIDCSPLSPFGRQIFPTLAPVRDTTMPTEEPLEHDLLLPVDSQTETPESVIVYASAKPPRASVGPRLPVNVTFGQASTESFVRPAAARFLHQAQGSPPMQRGNLTLRTSMVQPADHHNRSQTPYPSTLTKPIHRGWDDIKRYSRESTIPSPLHTPPPHSFCPTLSPILSTPPRKKRSLIQLVRKEPALAGSGQNVRTSTSSPLTVQIPFKYSPVTGFEGPKMSLLAKLNSIGEAQGEVVSPVIEKEESARSPRRVLKKRARESLPRWNAEDF